MIVDISNLPFDILVKIPLSLKVGKIEIDTDNIPYEYKYLIEQYIGKDKTNVFPIEYYPKTIYEIRPRLSIYNDFEYIEDIKTLISEYITNHFLINYGSNLFVPSYGSKIKYYLQTISSHSIENYINEELGKIIDDITSSYNIKVQVINSDIQRISNDTITDKYILNISLKVNNDELNLNLIA